MAVEFDMILRFAPALIIIIIIVAAIVISAKLEKKRREALRDIAMRRGFAFLEKPNSIFEDEVSKLKSLDKGRSRKIYNIIKGRDEKD